MLQYIMNAIGHLVPGCGNIINLFRNFTKNGIFLWKKLVIDDDDDSDDPNETTMQINQSSSTWEYT